MKEQGSKIKINQPKTCPRLVIVDRVSTSEIGTSEKVSLVPFFEVLLVDNGLNVSYESS